MAMQTDGILPDHNKDFMVVYYIIILIGTLNDTVIVMNIPLMKYYIPRIPFSE